MNPEDLCKKDLIPHLLTIGLHHGKDNSARTADQTAGTQNRQPCSCLLSEGLRTQQG